MTASAPATSFPASADLHGLLTDCRPPIVSLYLPAGPSPAASRSAPVRLKNLLREARLALATVASATPSEADALLSPLRLLLDADERPPQWARGLAAFACPAGVRSHWLPVTVRERVRVGDRPHLLPLLPHLDQQLPFAVLAIGQQHVRLFTANRHGIERIEPTGLPADIGEAVLPDDPEQSLQWHTTTPGAATAGTRSEAQFHAQGGGKDSGDHDLRTFFRTVDRAARPVLQPVDGDPLPLVLACVAEHLPLFREVSEHPDVLPEPIAGDPELLTPAELHERALTLLEPRLAAQRGAALERLRAAAAHDRTVTGPGPVIAAAHQGRVEALYLDLQVAPDDDLWDLAVAETLQNGGSVHADEGIDVPEGIAAVLRY